MQVYIGSFRSWGCWACPPPLWVGHRPGRARLGMGVGAIGAFASISGYDPSDLIQRSNWHAALMPPCRHGAGSPDVERCGVVFSSTCKCTLHRGTSLINSRDSENVGTFLKLRTCTHNGQLHVLRIKNISERQGDRGREKGETHDLSLRLAHTQLRLGCIQGYLAHKNPPPP